MGVDLGVRVRGGGIADGSEVRAYAGGCRSEGDGAGLCGLYSMR